MIDLSDINARDFFKAVKSDNTKEYKNFEEILDALFLARNNAKDKFELKNKVKLSELYMKLSVIETAKTYYQELPLDEQRRKKIRKVLKTVGFTLKHGTSEEVERQFKSFIGQIKNNIQLNILNDTKDSKDVKNINFSAVIVAFEMILEISISEDISLGKFVAYEQQANRKIAEAKKRKQNG